MNDKTIQVLRSLDKSDRMPPEDIFSLLTTGRLDRSGDFTRGCDLTPAQALILTGFVFSVGRPEIMARLAFIDMLEETLLNEAGDTAWDIFLRKYAALPEPKNIAHILDACINALSQQDRTGAMRP